MNKSPRPQNPDSTPLQTAENGCEGVLDVAPNPRPTNGERTEGATRRERKNHAVYILRDKDEMVLYVGISLRLAERINRHSKDKDWWRDVCNIEVRHAESRPEAERLEVGLIRELHPLHNVVHNGKPPTEAQIKKRITQQRRARSIAEREARDEIENPLCLEIIDRAFEAAYWRDRALGVRPTRSASSGVDLGPPTR